MPRRKKYKFRNPKMLSSRIEMEDYYKIKKKMREDVINLQQFLNTVVRCYISGTIGVDFEDVEENL